MRLIGYSTPHGPVLGTVMGGTVTPVGPVDHVYERLGDTGRSVLTGRAGPDMPLEGLTIVPPVPSGARVFCLGLNYRAHIAETGATQPAAPNIFGRWRSTLVGPGAEIPVPPGEVGLDWEAELAAVVGATLLDVDADAAQEAILGYTCFNDVSARTFQKAVPQFTVGKNADGSGPIGPVVVTPDELGDPYDLAISCRVDGETMQAGSTAQMILRVPETLAYISRCLTLRPGDVLATGTPDGVGFARTPPVLMGPGQTVEVEIEGIGVLSNRIVAR